MKKLLPIISLILLWACSEDELPKANFDLDAVTIFDGTVGHEKVDLEWEAPENNEPNGYVIKSTSANLEIQLDADVRFYEATGLNNGQNYDFNVQAIYGNQQISGAAKLELSPVDELNFTTLPGSELILATWNTPERDDISGYSLSWSDQVITLAADTTIYEITNLINGNAYEVELIINYASGETSNPVKSVATPGDVQPFLLSEDSPMSSTEVIFTYNPAFLTQSIAESWSWDFGDGTSSNEQNPTHTFSAPGVYTVSVLITDDEGSTFTGTRDVNVWGEKWFFQTGSDIKPSSPAIGNDGTIYVGSYDSKIYALNPDGTLKWSYTTGARINTSPAISLNGNTVYCGSDDDKMYALDANSGNVIWSFTTGGNIAFSTPAIANDGTLFFGSDDDKVYALNPNGSLKWELTTGDNVRSSPSIGADGTLYVASDDDSLYALNPDNGSIIWTYTVGDIVQGAPAIDIDGTIIIGVDNGGDDGAIVAVNPDGTEKWSVNVLGRISVCAPAIVGDTIYVGTKEGNNMLSLNKNSGALNWSYVTDGAIVNSSPAVDVNGVIYFGSWDDGVYAINPDGTLKYRFPTGGNVWSSPVIGEDGIIYVGSYDGKLYAIEMFAEGLSTDVWPMFGKNVKHTSSNQ